MDGYINVMILEHVFENIHHMMIRRRNLFQYLIFVLVKGRFCLYLLYDFTLMKYIVSRL